ncbi:MAG TPA: hypothetical protein V6C81_21660 [Planktothrix sp.]
MILDERCTAVRARLNAALEQARTRLNASELSAHRLDNVTLRALARDVERACAQALVELKPEEAPLAYCEELAKACEETLRETSETLRQKLRQAAEESTVC